MIDRKLIALIVVVFIMGFFVSYDMQLVTYRVGYNNGFDEGQHYTTELMNGSTTLEDQCRAIRLVEELRRYGKTKEN